jgi:hypothetical protein
MTWLKNRARSYLILVPSSTCMPRQTHSGWSKHYPFIHSWSEVWCRPTPCHTKLLSLGIPYVLYAPVHFKCLFNMAHPTRALIDTGGGYHLGALNIRSDHSSSFPSSILHFPLIAPPGLQLCQPFVHLAKPHRTSIDRKGPITSGFPTTRLLPIANTTKHSILSLYFIHRGKQSGLVRVFLVKLGFHPTPILKCTNMAWYKHYKAKSYSTRIQGACLHLRKKKS